MKINLKNKQDLVGANTLRHITYMKNQLKEKYVIITHHCVLLCLIYSVQTQAILTSLQEQGIEDVYIGTELHIYGQLSDSTSAQKE